MKSSVEHKRVGRQLTSKPNRYGAQIDAYAAAWTPLTGEAPVQVGLHAVRTGETVWRVSSGGTRRD